MLQTKTQDSFYVKTKEIKKVLSTITPSVKNKGMLSNIHIIVSGDLLYIYATDLDTYIKVMIPTYSNLELGNVLNFLVDFKQLKKIVYTSKKPKIRFHLSDNTLTIHNGDFETSLPTGNGGDFPITDFEDREVLFCKETKLLIPIFEKAILCSAKERTRYALDTILIDGNKIVSTDGKKLCIQNLETKKEVYALINRKTCEQILKCMKTNKKSFTQFKINDTSTSVDINGYEIESKLVTHIYPPYKQAIVHDNEDAQLYIKTSFFEYVLSLGNEDSISISTETIDPNKTNKYCNSIITLDEQEYETYTETRDELDKIEMKFDRKYLLDLMKLLIKEKVDGLFIELNNNGQLIIQQKYGNFKYVLMKRRNK